MPTSPAAPAVAAAPVVAAPVVAAPVVAATAAIRPARRSGRRLLGSSPPAELAVAARSGDAEAAGELFRRIRGRARRAAGAFCPDADADDAVAEGLTGALRQIDQLRDPAAVEAWMLRCVVRAAIDLSRQRRRQPPTAAVDALVDDDVRAAELAADRAMSILECDSMAQAVREMPSQHRLLLYLRYEVGLSVQHISVALAKPPGTVRRQCVEARRMAGQRFLSRQLRPAVGTCARVTEVLCREPYRRPPVQVRRQTTKHLRRCRACRDRQVELSAVLSELGFRTPLSRPNA